MRELIEANSIPEPNSGCWLWERSVGSKGYGLWTIRHEPGRRGRRTMVKAHRLSYEAYNGAIPSAEHILHRCDNPCCVNPEHLFTGTNRANVLDRQIKQRSAHQGIRAAKWRARLVEGWAKKAGFRGVRKKGNKYQGYVYRNGKQVSVGYFGDPEAAARAVEKARNASL